jgi:hypothetical protein
LSLTWRGFSECLGIPLYYFLASESGVFSQYFLWKVSYIRSS